MFRAFLALAFASLLSFAPAANAAPPTPPPIEDYGKLPGVEDVVISPTGDRYALITVVGETRQLVVATTDGKLLLHAVVGTTKVRGIRWAGDNFVLVTVSATVQLGMDFAVARQELSTVLIINVGTGKILPAFRANDQVAAVVEGDFGSALIGGRWYGFFGGITYVKDLGSGYRFDHGYPDLYRVDLETGDLSRVANGADDIRDWLVGPDGKVIARAYYSDTRGDWKICPGAFGGAPIAVGRNGFEGPSLEGLGKSSDKIIVGVPVAHGVMDEEIPLAGGEPKEVDNDASIASLWFDRPTGLWMGYTTIGDVAEPHLFDALRAARAKVTLKAYPNQSVRLESWSDDFSRLIVFTTGGDDSGTYWIVDIAKGHADPLGYEYPTVQPENVGPIKMVSWKAADGLELHGVLHLPPGRDASRLPVVVMPHGGPWARDYPVFDYWAQAFASRGYAVFQPNYRGSTGYGAALYDAGLGEYGGKMQTDISDGLAELARQGLVDPKRACIVGASYGGYSALFGVTAQQGLYRCSVAVAPITDLAGWVEYVSDEAGADSADRRSLKAFIGTGDLSRMSPARLADKADAPILLIYGKDDTQVPIEQSQRMQRALARAGKPVETVILPDEDHFMSREPTRILMVKSSVAFVEKYNPPDPPPAAAAPK